MIKILKMRTVLALLLCLSWLPAWAAFSCTMTTASVGVIYTAANVDTNGSVTITCTRDPAVDGASLTYRIKAADGTNAFATAPFRRARLGATTNYLRYILRRGTAVGGAAACGNTTTWRAPATGTTNVITGTLNFTAGSSVASATWGYCIRVRGTAGGNPAAPTAGIYVDSFLVTAQYPNNDAGALSPSVPATYTVGVNNQCVFNTFPTGMSFNYTSFSATPQVQTRPFDLRCSNALPWSLAISPASNVLLGLNYSISASPASGMGTGADQVITLTGTIPAGQAGTCATSGCSASQAHVVTITY
jgi:hypothetical protein